jgi:hypothetical protein
MFFHSDKTKVLSWQMNQREKFQTGKGYWLLYKPNHPRAKRRRGYVFEHIWVMEEYVNQFLTPNNEVHHIDINPNNNDISNLLLIPSQREHRILHQLKEKEPTQYQSFFEILLKRQEDVKNGIIDLQKEWENNKNEFRAEIKGIITEGDISELTYCTLEQMNKIIEKLLQDYDEKELSRKVLVTLYELQPKLHFRAIQDLLIFFKIVNRPRNINNLFDYLVVSHGKFRHAWPIIQGTWSLYHMLKEYTKFHLNEKNYLLLYKNLKSSSNLIHYITKRLIQLPQFDKEKISKVIDFLKIEGTPSFSEEELNLLLYDPFLEENELE